MKVRITLTEDMLGTASNNPEIHREFIASKAPNAAGIEEEVAAIGVDAVEQKQMTVFPKENGRLFLWDYQVKGFLKEAIGILLEISEEVKVGKTRLTKFTHKRLVDNYVFVYPRKIFINGELGTTERGFPLKDAKCSRPLRAETMQGERVSLACSESIVAGATLEFEVETLTPTLMPMIEKALNYGSKKGLGQWRNSGKGRFTWVEVK